MQKTVFEFPDRINEFVVGDTLFARAYQNTPDHRRALIKTGIARLFEWYGPARTAEGRTTLQWRSGFDSVQQSTTVDFSVVVFDESLVSSARLLAGIVPALACGVRNVLAVRMGQGEWAESLLTGMELAGQELVLEMTQDQVKGLLDDLGQTGATGTVLGIDLDPGVFRSLGFPSDRIGFHWMKCERTASVWMDGEHPFDLDGLAFVHPDVDFSIYGLETPLPGDRFSYGGKDFYSFLDSIRNVAFAPASHINDALDRAQLVLGPGQEGCWAWPQLWPEFFQYHSTAWTTGA